MNVALSPGALAREDLGRTRADWSARAPSSRWSLPAAIGLLFLVFLVDGHRLDRSTLTNFVESAEDRAAGVAQGNWQRRAAFLGLAATGVLLLLTSDRRPMITSVLGLMVVGAVVWSFVSIGWADDRALAFKRLTVFGFCLLGAMGLASRFRLDDLCRVTVWVTSIYALIGIGAEIMHGNFRPWSGGYRFAGTLHPNAQALNCGAMSIAGFLLRRSHTRRVLYVLMFLAGLCCLVLTKSRTATGGTLIAVGLLWSLKRTAGIRWIAVVGVAWIAVAGTMAGMFVNSSGGFTNAVNLGRESETAAGNGRYPIWTTCWDMVARRAPIGFGYENFWLPERIEYVSWTVGWPLSSAHSAYLEVVLSIGLIGLALYLAVIGLGVTHTFVRHQSTAEIGAGFLFGVLLLGAIQALMESGFSSPTALVPFIASVGIARLAFFEPPQHLTPSFVEAA